ncbi:MAG: hypothetical protein IT234_00265, partial [Bacteroidia bacterium]|nr:hypothetical protein [Bacteroidia bacterium]
MKHLLFFITVSIISITVKAQSGIKWSTNGNSATQGDFIGTINNEDLIFKTNNSTALRIKTNGNIIIKSLDNQGNGLVTFDNSGKIQPLIFNSNANEVLYSNGTWGALPNIPTLSWLENGHDIYYMNGKVGIGTSNPLVNLDVIGDARISNNLYVGGGIIITDKVNANTEVKTAAINADSIKMDSTKAVYGFSNFKGDVKLDSKLQVVGDARINGDLNINGSFSFGNNHTLSYYPANPTTPQLFGWGIPTSVIGSVIPQLIQCQSSNTVTGGTSNLFQGKIQCFGNNLTPTGSYNIMTMGYDGANGVIDVSGDNTNGGTVHGTTGPDLLINYNCGKNIYMCTGAMGGVVATGKNFEVGNPDRNEN